MGENDLKEVFKRLNAIEQVLAKIEANTNFMTKTLVDHESRLRGLENWQWKAIGFSTAIASMISTAVAILAAVLGR